ncbi:MAG: hypothetical protein KF760_08920, partial [Candidatus Eremiobacteraeota bacterium]|nr:hypothetical protein [Candidatus Eremiobacteraeota bacterium]
MDDLRKRLERLEHRLERNQKHTELVLSTQREVVEKAFDQVRLAMFEQEAILRAHSAETREALHTCFPPPEPRQAGLRLHRKAYGVK